MDQWQVLAIMFRTVVNSAMMIDVSVVNKGWCEKRNAAENIPDHAENSKVRSPLMDQFVNKKSSSVEKQT